MAVIGQLSADVRVHRDWLASFVPSRKGIAVADLGCGTGEDLIAMATRLPDSTARLVGVDSSEKSIAAALERAGHEQRLSFRQQRLTDRLPFETASLDVVYSNNLLECLAHPATFVQEVARILKPGGTAIVAHWDLDSQIFDGADKARLRRLIHAYADWQQPWMEHCDGCMGRRLHGLFGSSGLFDGGIHTRVLTNTVFAAPWYGHARAQDFSSLVRRQRVTAEDYAGFWEEQVALHAQGRYFYCITGFAYVGIRTAPSL